jgi:hypothetical protein
MTLSLDNNNKVKTVLVKLDAPVLIPNSVYVTLTDNKAHVYRKRWNGEPLVFILPVNFDFVATASSFITENGKMYLMNGYVDVKDSMILSYTSKSGIELDGDILAVYNDTYDWYIYLDKLSGKWSTESNNIEKVTVDEILSSDANGFENTNVIANTDRESIFANALKHESFGNDIVGYIPSYIEIELLRNNLDNINEFLITEGKSKISLDNIWVSEAFDNNNAWDSNGNVLPKDTVRDYYIFGRKITKW